MVYSACQKRVRGKLTSGGGSAILHQQALQDDQEVAADETTHFDIFILPDEGPQDNQYLAGCVHGTGIDEILRGERSRSSLREHTARDR